MTPVAIAAYLVLFITVATLFLGVNLLVGRLLRPRYPTAEKQEIYECGEPTIGSSQVQFDLRFYVVALLFLVFEVEVAFFFPWANVFGTATQMADPALAEAVSAGSQPATIAARHLYHALAAEPPVDLASPGGAATMAATGRMVGWMAFVDILVFFGVLLVGFAYLWRRGDINWVRAFSLTQPDSEDQLLTTDSSTAVSTTDLSEPVLVPHRRRWILPAADPESSPAGPQ